MQDSGFPGEVMEMKPTVATNGAGRAPWCLGTRIIGFLVAVLLAVAPGTSSAERRVALVIGNAAYEERAAELVSAVGDARSVARALRELDFDDVFLREDLDREGMERAADDFIGTLRSGDVAVFYYAGHGAELDDGLNYLLPVDFSSSYDRVQARTRSLRADEVQARMEAAGAQIRILILDACRDNPFDPRMRWMGPRGGLSQMRPRGGLVAFATEAGDTAADSGLYARHFVDALAVPGLPAMELFTRVSEAVELASGGDQVPIQQFGGSLGRFVFHREDAARAEAVEASLELDWVTRRAIQRRLQQDDFDPGPLDGLMGSRTRAAIRRWQDAQGLRPTGYLDARQAGQLREPSFPLHDAAWAGDVAEIRRLLAAGVDVNALDLDRKTPLHFAAADGHVEAIDALIEAGANVDARDDSGYGSGITPLHVAVAHDHPGAITALIAVGADVNSGDRPFSVAPLHVALGARGSQGLFVDRTAVNRRHSAAAVVRSLLSAGANAGSRASIDGYTPLQHAASRRNGSGPDIDLAVIRALLAAGADPNDVPLIVGDPGPEDYSPSALHFAARAGDVAVIEALIAAGADVHVTALGGRYPDYVYRTPLDYAVTNGHNAAAAVLSAHETR